MSIISKIRIYFLQVIMPAYFIYLISTILHECAHKRKAKKYNLTLLKSKQELINHKQESEISNLSLFLFGIQFKGFGASVHIKDGEIEKLSYDKQKEVLLAGIYSDILFSLFLVIVLRFYYQLFILIALGIIIVKTLDNIFDFFNMGGDVRKLNTLKNKKEKS
jgi:hypothetical protein